MPGATRLLVSGDVHGTYYRGNGLAHFPTPNASHRQVRAFCQIASLGATLVPKQRKSTSLASCQQAAYTPCTSDRSLSSHTNAVNLPRSLYAFRSWPTIRIKVTGVPDSMVWIGWRIYRRAIRLIAGVHAARADSIYLTPCFQALTTDATVSIKLTGKGNAAAKGDD